MLQTVVVRGRAVRTGEQGAKEPCGLQEDNAVGLVDERQVTPRVRAISLSGSKERQVTSHPTPFLSAAPFINPQCNLMV